MQIKNEERKYAGTNNSQHLIEDSIIRALKKSDLKPEIDINGRNIKYQIEAKKHPDLYTFLLQKFNEINLVKQPEKISQFTVCWSKPTIFVYIRRGV